MIQPPNTSPAGLRSAGIGIMRSASGLVVGAGVKGWETSLMQASCKMESKV